jgi:hypothetical protein
MNYRILPDENQAKSVKVKWKPIFSSQFSNKILGYIFMQNGYFFEKKLFVF